MEDDFQDSKRTVGLDQTQAHTFGARKRHFTLAMVGGNFPIPENTSAGECRQVAGLDEYRRLSRTAPS